MTVTQISGSVITQPGQQFALSSLFNLGPGLPATIGIDIYDDGNYTEGNPGTLGYLSGNGARSVNSLVAASGQDFGYVLFQYDSKTGQYYNSSLGYWNAITYVAPTGNDHTELLSVFSLNNGTSFSLSNVTDYGDLSIATESAFSNPFPGAMAGQATPDEICAIAQSYVGKVWAQGACALLVEVIATLAGSSPPISEFATSVTQPTPAQPNGEWIVAYDGHIQAKPSVAAVEAMIRPGDIVSLDWQNGGTGHDFTVVSGSGANALVVDNWDFGGGTANDGSPNDMIILPPHSLDTLLQQNGGALPVSIEVYRLDTPIITAQAAPPTLAAESSLALSSLFGASDPAGKIVISYQLYDSAAGNSFTVNGTTETAHSAATAVTVSSLASISLAVGADGGSDVVEVRGYNGTYWGDWQSLTVTSAAALTAAQAIGNAAAGQAVLDSTQNVVASLDGLSALAAKGELASIQLTDGGTPNLIVTTAQFAADQAALKDITSAHTVTVQMSGNASQHNFSADNWTGASALQFADQTVIVAATPGSANVTTGNVTELYSAVLAREPDIGGLAFYQTYLKANPTTPLLQFAEWFLTSSEYSSAHNYAQTTAGETQFITDSYQNLLHRAPSADEVNFYLTNVLEKPGTQLQNHAQMLVYFSASPEFLGDVQITAANPASAQHWLFLT
ncbi:MAG TPA: DUF4214 domain-containing protein [Magnetospirillaceae bacterium]|nr:DUF4214 domain-containing protein [Magnetospirillaceae bacterium]